MEMTAYSGWAGRTALLRLDHILLGQRIRGGY
jgi:hypothetical protein